MLSIQPRSILITGLAAAGLLLGAPRQALGQG